MDHVVYLDERAKELDLLISGKKQMIIRGATGRKIPYGRVNPNDVLYFILNNGEGELRARAKVKKVIHSDKLSETESAQLIEQYQGKLQLTPKQLDRWTGKRYLVLIEICDVETVEPIRINKAGYENMDDWLPVERIESVLGTE